MSISSIEDETRKQIIAYTIRFKEVLLLMNSKHDERFCNTPSARSVISLPIIRGDDLIGVLYLVSYIYAFSGHVALSIGNSSLMLGSLRSTYQAVLLYQFLSRIRLNRRITSWQRLGLYWF